MKSLDDFYISKPYYVKVEIDGEGAYMLSHDAEMARAEYRARGALSGYVAGEAYKNAQRENNLLWSHVMEKGYSQQEDLSGTAIMRNWQAKSRAEANKRSFAMREALGGFIMYQGKCYRHNPFNDIFEVTDD